MATLRRLAPHDPVPETGRFLLVMRRFGEDAPRLAITELVASDGEAPPRLSIPADATGTPLDFEAAVREAVALAGREGFATVYAVDRTAGTRESAVLAHDGDHTIGMDTLADSDPEDGEAGSDLRDRAPEEGRNLTPRR